MSILKNIREIIAETLCVDINLIESSTAVGDLEEWNSMGNVAIISAIEEKLAIEFPIEDLFDLNSVASLVEAVERLKKDE